MADVSINTVTKLLVDVGRACQAFHDETVKGVKSKRVQCDEIWSFVYSKQKNVHEDMPDGSGDVWTWTGIDADSKLIVSWYVGDRTVESADYFMHDLKDRLANPVQLTTDGHKPYLQAVENAFEGAIDYAMLIKIYGQPTSSNPTERKYSPNECTGFEIKRISGNPNIAAVSTSYVERQNLTMRMHMRRFTRLTNAFSKKIENHCYAIALHFVYYNFAKIHKTLRVTPAMQAGLMDRWMEISDIVKLTDKY
jgi:IS1 family transposase